MLSPPFLKCPRPRRTGNAGIRNKDPGEGRTTPLERYLHFRQSILVTLECRQASPVRRGEAGYHHALHSAIGVRDQDREPCVRPVYPTMAGDHGAAPARIPKPGDQSRYRARLRPSGFHKRNTSITSPVSRYSIPANVPWGRWSEPRACRFRKTGERPRRPRPCNR